MVKNVPNTPILVNSELVTYFEDKTDTFNYLFSKQTTCQLIPNNSTFKF